jgi:DNA primase large subunit
MLRACTPPALLKDFKDEKYYKVPWTRVPDLVERRRVVLRGGVAYVAGREQSSIVFQQFHTDLEKALEVRTVTKSRTTESNDLFLTVNCSSSTATG